MLCTEMVRSLLSFNYLLLQCEIGFIYYLYLFVLIVVTIATFLSVQGTKPDIISSVGTWLMMLSFSIPSHVSRRRITIHLLWTACLDFSTRLLQLELF
jgi:hypothetical protein